MVKVSNYDLPAVIITLLCISLLIFSGLASAAAIQVSSDRNPVGLNESFQLVYTSTESVDDDPDFSALEKYLDILNRSQSSNVSIINGRYSSTKTWTLTVMARQVGVINLPPIQFGSDQSASYKLTVKATAKNQQAQSGFYTRIRVDQEQVYAQQQLVITQQLFSDKNLSAYGLGELDFNGMDVISQSLGEEKQYKTRVGDRAYLVIERNYALFPQVSGLLKISPVLAEARMGRGSSSFFDSFGQSNVVRARSNAVDVAVLPVPKNSHVNPWLPAKDFQLLEQWPQNPPEFVQGEPLTRTLSIKAEGLTAAQLPVLPDISIEGLKQYPDQALLNDIKNDTGITGYRLEKVALIPTEAGQITLPAIEIPWWNTTTQQREVARIAARTINVQASTATIPEPQTPQVAQQGNTQEEPAQQETQTQQHLIDKPTSSNLWFILTLVFGSGWLVTIIAWFIIHNKKDNLLAIDLTRSALPLKKVFNQLKTACEKKDAAECRGQLLLWAQALLTDQDIRNLQDLSQFASATLNEELAKIDARLYGGQKPDIKFTVIVEQAEKMMREDIKKSRESKPQLLEPLYK